MKITLALILMILSLNALAVRMCPVRTLEIVSCKEAGYVSISICENAEGKISMTYKHPASPEVVMFPTEMKEEERTLSFKRLDESSEKMELVVFKSVDDHTRGVLKLTSAGIQSQLSMRCLTRASEALHHGKLQL